MNRHKQGIADNLAEMLDYYDSHGKRLGTLPRGEIHARELINRHEAFYIVNGKNELLLQRRSPKKDLNPGLWDKLGGHVPAGKEYSLTEAVEEACHGLNVRPRLLNIYDFVKASKSENLARTMILTNLDHKLNYHAVRLLPNGTEKVETVHLRSFLGRYDGLLSPQTSEVETLKWYTRNELEKAMRRDPRAFTHDLHDGIQLYGARIFR